MEGEKIDKIIYSEIIYPPEFQICQNASESYDLYKLKIEIKEGEF